MGCTTAMTLAEQKMGHDMTKQSQYTRAGVNLDAGQQAVELMKDAVRATYGPAVLSDTSNFGGLYDASHLKGLTRPVLGRLH